MNKRTKKYNYVKRENVAIATLASSERGKLPRLQYPRDTLENLRKDRVGHEIIKSESKYRRCKVCKHRFVYLCQNAT